jgi:benzil reductase ((S)-benzoin forming)
MPSIFITGNSSGIGLALTETYLEQGWEVYGLSRRGCELGHERLHDIHANLGELDTISDALDELLGNTDGIDLVILNAGILGQVKNMHETSQAEIDKVMDINVWANKVIFDWFIHSGTRVDQVAMISSGAAKRGQKGWNAYALSKGTFKMLGELYAHEMPDTHIISVAPGMVHTAMQDYLIDNELVNEYHFPSVKAMRNAIGTDVMPEPNVVAERLFRLIPELRSYPSGGFVDIRDL